MIHFGRRALFDDGQGPVPSSIAQLVRYHARAYAAGAVFLGAFQWTLNRLDWLTKAAIDGPRTESTRVALTMLALAAVAFVTRIAGRMLVLSVGHDAEYELRNRLLYELHRLGMSFYRTMPVGDITSRATGDLIQIRIALAFGMVNLINVPLACASALQVMIRVHVGLTLASLVLVPVMVATTRAFSPRMFARTRAHQARLGELSAMLHTSLAGARLVRAFAVEDGMRARFEEANRRTLEANTSLAQLRSAMGPVYRSGALLGLLACFWYGTVLLARGPWQGGITRGEFFAFWMAFGRMAWPMVGIGIALVTFARGRAGLARVREIFEAKHASAPAGTIPAGGARALRGALSLREVSFAHGERQVLDRVSLDIGAGESVAVVGRAGSGKSTLAALIARLLPVPAGTIFLDGIDVCAMSLEEARGAIAYAQQEPFLFSTHVSRNVAIGERDRERDREGGRERARVRAALEDAHVMDEVLAWPLGLDTVVGERGSRLSGGQKQRVALARALVREAPILLLDDPVSAVDARTEKAILAAIERRTVDRTLVLFTHRVTAAARCSRIVVLDGGRIVDQGSHADLSARGGIYAALFEEQVLRAALERTAPETRP